MVHMAPGMYVCMIPCQQIGMGKILGMPESFVDTCHLLNYKRRTNAQYYACMLGGVNQTILDPSLVLSCPNFAKMMCKPVKIH